MVQGNRDKFTEDEIRSALIQAMGLKAHACKILDGCSFTTLQRYIEKYKLDDFIKQLKEEIVDDVEKQVIVKAAQLGERWAVELILKAKASDRGYGDKQKIELEGKMENTVKIDQASIDAFRKRLIKETEGQ